MVLREGFAELLLADMYITSTKYEGKMIFEFSLPMPYSKENINKLTVINNEIEKSKIKTLFFSLPSSCELYTGFEQPRNRLIQYSDFSFWKILMEYSLEKNFDIIYNFNLARPVDIENPNLNIQLEKLNKILIELQKIGIKNLRIYNMQLLEYISKYYPCFDLYVSTVTNYKTIHEFENLKILYPQIKQIVPSQDMNKNFELLNNIKNKLNINLEIMCNDGCVQGCINFYNHHGMTNYEDNYLYGITCTTSCEKLNIINPFIYLCRSNHVFPWDIEEYGKIGITKFKLTGRDGINDIHSSNAINLYYKYLLGIDNCKKLNYYPIVNFLNNSRIQEKFTCLTGKDIIHLMPKIQHFRKYGHLCASQCGIKCIYCYKCSKKIQKVYEKKIKKKQDFIPACTIIKNEYSGYINRPDN